MELLDIEYVTINSKGQITIPSAFQKLNMKENDEVVMLVYDDHIEIRPMEFVEEKLGMPKALEKALSEHWDNPEEDKAWEYLQEYVK